MTMRIVCCFGLRIAIRMLRCSRGLALFVLSASEGFAFVAVDAPDVIGKLQGVDARWHDVHMMHVGGVETHAVSFTSLLSADVLARSFTENSQVFDRILTMPGHLVLSGLQANWHWLAVVNATPSGTHGYVSVMSSARTPDRTEQPWLGLSDSLVFSYRDLVDGKEVTQQIHRVPTSMAVLNTHMKKNLERQGWTLQGGSDGQWRWYRAGEQLSIMILADVSSTLIFSHHAGPGRE